MGRQMAKGLLARGFSPLFLGGQGSASAAPLGIFDCKLRYRQTIAERQRGAWKFSAQTPHRWNFGKPTFLMLFQVRRFFCADG